MSALCRAFGVAVNVAGFALCLVLFLFVVICAVAAWWVLTLPMRVYEWSIERIVSRLLRP